MEEMYTVKLGTDHALVVGSLGLFTGGAETDFQIGGQRYGYMLVNEDGPIFAGDDLYASTTEHVDLRMATYVLATWFLGASREAKAIVQGLPHESTFIPGEAKDLFTDEQMEWLTLHEDDWTLLLSEMEVS